VNGCTFCIDCAWRPSSEACRALIEALRWCPSRWQTWAMLAASLLECARAAATDTSSLAPLGAEVVFIAMGRAATLLVRNLHQRHQAFDAARFRSLGMSVRHRQAAAATAQPRCEQPRPTALVAGRRRTSTFWACSVVAARRDLAVVAPIYGCSVPSPPQRQPLRTPLNVLVGAPPTRLPTLEVLTAKLAQLPPVLEALASAIPAPNVIDPTNGSSAVSPTGPLDTLAQRASILMRFVGTEPSHFSAPTAAGHTGDGPASPPSSSTISARLTSLWGGMTKDETSAQAGEWPALVSHFFESWLAVHRGRTVASLWALRLPPCARETLCSAARSLLTAAASPRTPLPGAGPQTGTPAVSVATEPTGLAQVAAALYLASELDSTADAKGEASWRAHLLLAQQRVADVVRSGGEGADDDAESEEGDIGSADIDDAVGEAMAEGGGRGGSDEGEGGKSEGCYRRPVSGDFPGIPLQPSDR